MEKKSSWKMEKWRKISWNKMRRRRRRGIIKGEEEEKKEVLWRREEGLMGNGTNGNCRRGFNLVPGDI